MNYVRFGLILAGTSGLVACDVPTDVPMVEQRWIVPIENTSISVEEFLPDGVTIVGDLFSLTVDPFTSEKTLGQLCPVCVNGPAVAPPFVGTFSASESLPGGASAAVLESASVTVAVQNGLSFDPVAGGGSMVITITDGPGGKVLGQATISTAMAPGSTVTRGIILAGGPVGSSLTASSTLTSVGGQNANVNTSNKIVLSVEGTAIQASFATVPVAGRAVSLDATELDVADIDDTITDHIVSGAIILDITNPFGVAVSIDLVIDYPGGSVTKQVNIPGTAVSTTSISYTGAELRSFLGKEGVILSGSGSVSGTAGEITVHAAEQLVLDATFDLTLVIG